MCCIIDNALMMWSVHWHSFIRWFIVPVNCEWNTGRLAIIHAFNVVHFRPISRFHNFILNQITGRISSNSVKVYTESLLITSILINW